MKFDTFSGLLAFNCGLHFSSNFRINIAIANAVHALNVPNLQKTTSIELEEIAVGSFSDFGFCGFTPNDFGIARAQIQITLSRLT